MVGSLIYAAIATRPDIAYAVAALAKFNSSPTEAHLTAVKRVFRYLKGTAQLRLQYQETDSDDRRSISGNVFVMSGGAISWTSKKQPTVALSTSESEYIALCFATQEAVWLRQLMKDLQMDCTTATTIYEDNQGAIAMSRNPVLHKRTKHIDIKYHFVQGKTQDGTIELKDILMTKPLSKGQFEYLRCKLGLIQGHVE
jgi:hypothetical protein